ncbi:protein of unknown function (plasmid) [Rhodovastum atsumiense]|nr:protein of unknown function [Rhodovastum atsumiense]
MNGEIMHRFQKFPVVVLGLATARLSRVENLQHDRLVLFRHARPSNAGDAVIRRMPNQRIGQNRMSGIPSIGPKEEAPASVL